MRYWDGLQRVRDVSPLDLGLPFERWRKHQDEAIAFILEALTETEHKAAILNAPTGTGKSAVAVASAVILGKRTVIAVSTKQLSDQYAESLGDVVFVMKGRGNYICPITGLTADSAPCVMGTLEELCELKANRRCPYYLEKAKAMSAPIVVTNYAYLLNELNYAGGMARDFLVLDEAHNLDSELSRFISVSINLRTLASLGLSVPNSSLSSVWKRWANEILPIVREEFSKVKEALEKAVWTREEARRAVQVKSLYDNLQRLGAIGDTWLKEERPQSISFHPVWVKEYARAFLYGYFQYILAMSATPPYPPSVGIYEFSFKEVPHTFPVQNRPFIYQPMAKMSKFSSIEDFRKIVQFVDSILDKYPNQKGIVHCTSYKMRDAIFAYSKRVDRLVSHGASDRSEALAEFKASPDPLVMVSPSMGEGVSLDDEASRFQIITKVPFPDLGSPLIRARANEDRDWYNAATVSAIVQTYGRIVRSATDWGITYMADGNFGWFFQSQKERFPNWFKEAIIWKKEGGM